MKVLKLVQVSLLVLAIGSVAHAVREGDFPELENRTPYYTPPAAAAARVQTQVRPAPQAPVVQQRGYQPRQPITPPPSHRPPPPQVYNPPPRHSPPPPPQYGGGVTTQAVTCSSEGGRTASCYVGRGYVRMTRQISKSACVQGSTWQYNVYTGYVEVTQGCRAEFEITGNANPADDIVSSIGCESIGGRYNSCGANMRILTVTLERQTSKTACVYGSTWGYDNSRVWVNAGCRGTFRVTGF